MGGRRVRPVIPMVGAVLVAVAAGLVLAGKMGEAATERARDHMIGIAARINDPPGLVTRSRSDCPDQLSLVRCLTATQEPDALAATYQRALSRAAGTDAALMCTTLPYGQRPRSCLVRIDDGGHAVLVSIDSSPMPGPVLSRSGSVVRIDAD